MSKLFQSQCIPMEMRHSKDATFRAGDNRVPVDGTLQYRWADSMATIRPETQRKFLETSGQHIARHPVNPDSSPFYMTGGTRRVNKDMKG